MAKARRTTHRSSAGKKLYAVRDASGRFKDNGRPVKHSRTMSITIGKALSRLSSGDLRAYQPGKRRAGERKTHQFHGGDVVVGGDFLQGFG